MKFYSKFTYFYKEYITENFDRHQQKLIIILQFTYSTEQSLIYCLLLPINTDANIQSIYSFHLVLYFCMGKQNVRLGR